MRRRLCRCLGILGASLLLVACKPDQLTATSRPPTAVVTMPPIPVTATAPGVKPTLPPTWTQTPLPTPRPTSTSTLTSSPPATQTSDQVCSAFQIIAAPLDNAQFDFAGSASFGWRGVPTNTTLIITIGLKDTTGNTQPGIRVEVPFEGDGVFPFPLMRLPTNEGLYEWKIWLQHPQYGTICTHSGTFLRRPAVPVLL